MTGNPINRNTAFGASIVWHWQDQRNHVGDMRVEIFDSADRIPEASWQELLGQSSITQSVDFWRVVEQSGLNDFRYQHAMLVDDNGNPLALTTFYTVTTDLAIFSSGRLRGLLEGIRRVFPGFLKVRMLECGTPITISPPCILREGVEVLPIVRMLSRLLLEQARRDKAWVIVVRDFEAPQQFLLDAFESQGFVRARNLPNTYLDVHWSDVQNYLASMKSYYRSKLRKHLKRAADQNIRHELRQDFDHLAETLCRQWRVVHEQADEYQREVLTPDFYRRFASELGGLAYALLFYRGDALIGHALVLRDGKMLRWLYFGREQAANDSLYLYVAHAVIQSAIELGLERVEMGLTTYSIKRDLGARMVDTRMALSGRWSWLTPLLGWGYRLLNAPPSIDNKIIFKQPGDG